MARIIALFALLWFCASALLFQTNNDVDQSEREKPVFIGDQVRDTQIAVNGSLRLFRGVKERIPLIPAAITWLCGTGLLMLALYYAREPFKLTISEEGHLSPARNQWILLGFGIVLLGILAESNGRLFEQVPFLNYNLQYALLCFGVILISLGIGNIYAPATEDSQKQTPWRLIFALTLVGFALRIWDLNRLRVMVDELPFTEAAFTFMQNPRQGLLVRMSNVFPFPHLFPYWIRMSINQFGDSYAAIRVPSAIFGTLTLPVMFLLADRLFNRRVALLSMILFISFPPHLHFSRLSMLHVCDTFGGVAAFAFLLQGLQTRHRMNFALSGLALGFTQYFYEGGRLLFPVLMVIWCMVLLLQNRAHWRGISLMWIMAILVAAPVYYTLYGNQESGVQRLETVGLTNEYWNRLLQASSDDPIIQAHFDRTLNPLLHLFSVPDMSVFYSGDTPLLLLYLVPFFFMGVAYLLYHWRHPASSLLLSWIIGCVLGSSVLVESGVTARFVVVFPALILTTALGLWLTFHLLIPDSRRAWFVMATLALLFSFGQGYYYFFPHLTQFDYEIRHIKPYPDGEDALHRFIEGDYYQGTTLIIISDPPTSAPYLSQIFRLLSGDQYFPFDARHPHEIHDPYLRNLQTGFDIVFFMRPDDTETLTLIQKYFELEPPVRSPYHEQIPDDRELWLYFAPAFTLESAEPVEWNDE